MRTGTRIGMAAAVALMGAMGPAAEAGAQVLRPEGAAEQVGQVVGGALDTAGRAVERGFRTAFARTRGAVETMEVTSRVYSRLLWDKELVGGRYAIDARPGGVVVLRGSAPSREASDRAAALAVSTVGVAQVINELVAPGSSAVGVPGPAVIVPGRGVPRAEPGLDLGPAPSAGQELEPLRDPAPPRDPAPLVDPVVPRDPEPTINAEDLPAPTIRPPLPTP